MSFPEVTELEKKLKFLRSPWRPDSYLYVRDSLLKLGVRVLYGEAQIGQAPVMFDMYCVGTANLLALASGGRAVAGIDRRDMQTLMRITSEVAWLNDSGGWMWESATLKHPGELAKAIEAQMPAVSKGLWTARARQLGQ